MAIFRGFVHSLQIRDDGWVEAIVQAVHAGNSRQTFFIRDLDGDITVSNRRLAQLGLLRDAVARVLPVEVEYSTGEEGQSNIIEDLTIHPRPSIDGRPGTRRVEGVVIGLNLSELGPLSGVTPYLDAPDVANISLLEDDGTVELLRLDLQRPDPLTAQSMLQLFRDAHRTRRPIAVLVGGTSAPPAPKGRDRINTLATTGTTPQGAGWVQACEWITVPEETLDYVYAYVERLGQRYESYESSSAPALSNVRVVYTTAPGQTPEGDISDNGTFTPQRQESWVHGDSPLFRRLEAALRDQLQVALGLRENRIHEVELVAGLGSIAKPIWIKANRCPLPPLEDDCLCENTPTVRQPGAQDLDELRVRVAWRAEAYFAEGIWRFVLLSGSGSTLRIDGKEPCCETGDPCGPGKTDSIDQAVALQRMYDRPGRAAQCHAYLRGLHHIELTVCGRRCSEPFQLKVYRIR